MAAILQTRFLIWKLLVFLAAVSSLYIHLSVCLTGLVRYVPVWRTSFATNTTHAQTDVHHFQVKGQGQMGLSYLKWQLMCAVAHRSDDQIYLLKFYWNLFLGIQLTKSQHWFKPSPVPMLTQICVAIWCNRVTISDHICVLSYVIANYECVLCPPLGSSPKTKRHEPKLTVPKTPNFETRTRARPVTAISHAELEEQEIEEQRKWVAQLGILKIMDISCINSLHGCLLIPWLIVLPGHQHLSCQPWVKGLFMLPWKTVEWT